MTPKTKISRKKFFKISSYILLMPFAYLWHRTVSRSELFVSKQKIFLPRQTSNEITFLDKVILINKEDGELLLSSKCTHLGCSISKYENGLFVCPCHGSKYSIEGNVIEGPASEPLAKLEIKIDNKTGERFVEV